MAVENELIYIVRLNAEGEEEIVKARRVIDDTGKAATKGEKKLGKLGSAMGSAGKSSKNFRKQSSAANNALLDLTRIAQDAPYGIRGIANNLEQAASSSGRAITQFGGVGAAIKGMVGSLTGVGGLVAATTAFSLVMQGAESGLFSFGEETRDVSKDLENLYGNFQRVIEIQESLGSFKDDQFGISRSRAEIRELTEDLDQQRSNLKRLNELEEQRVEILEEQPDPTARTDQQKQRMEQVKNEMRLYGSIDDVKDNINTLEDKRLQLVIDLKNTADALADSDTKQAQQKKRQLEYEEKISKARQKVNEQIQRPKDTIVPDPLSDEQLKTSFDVSDEQNWVREQMKRSEQRLQAQQQVEQQIQQMRIQFARNTGQRISAINMQEQQDKKQIRSNELLDKEQNQRAITAIERKYSLQRKNIAQQERRNREQQEQRLLQTKLDSAALVINSLQGFGSVIAGESEKNARQRFEANKAFNYAAAVMNTANAVTKALSSSPPPFNFIQAGSVGAAGAVQIAKIAAQKFRSGGGFGGPGGNGSVGYRGFSFDSPTRNATNAQGRPGRDPSRDRSQRESRSIRIEDGFGNLVMKGQEEIDRSGGDNYVRRAD